MLNLLKKLFSKIKLSGFDRRWEVAQLTIHNSAEAYDKLWGDQELLKHYWQPARIEAYREVITYIINKDCGGRVVELGFGSGDFLRMLIDESSRKFEVYGVDYAESGVIRTRKIIPNGEFIHGSIYNLPYDSNYFDQVYCIQTLEHLHKPEEALQEMDRICKPDGMIILTVPNGDFDNFKGHVQFWSVSSFKKFLGPRELINFMMLNQNRAMMAALKPNKNL